MATELAARTPQGAVETASQGTVASGIALRRCSVTSKASIERAKPARRCRVLISWAGEGLISPPLRNGHRSSSTFLPFCVGAVPAARKTTRDRSRHWVSRTLQRHKGVAPPIRRRCKCKYPATTNDASRQFDGPSVIHTGSDQIQLSFLNSSRDLDIFGQNWPVLDKPPVTPAYGFAGTGPSTQSFRAWFSLEWMDWQEVGGPRRANRHPCPGAPPPCRRASPPRRNLSDVPPARGPSPRGRRPFRPDQPGCARQQSFVAGWLPRQGSRGACGANDLCVALESEDVPGGVWPSGASCSVGGVGSCDTRGGGRGGSNRPGQSPGSGGGRVCGRPGRRWRSGPTGFT